MKIRNGFVSNSSSSSFIIRGMKLTKDEIIKTLNIPQEEIDDFEEDDYEFSEFLGSKLGFSIQPDGNYFGSRDYNTLIVGESIGHLNDGEARELKDRTPEDDAKIIAKFEALGFTGKILKTYVQMVSNDNY